ncbi:hypothetical protein FOL46_006052 [Perkinsus olseni]|uniref:Uncharacterized protein n=1 Tax=Perkinsus olseni TaxID=32597 RepID=A0A7J6LNU5_PEROL|nr:hypothetical protein FOL46_006052 [Perkinsus olseni]
MFAYDNVRPWEERWAILDGLEKAVSTGFLIVVIGLFALMMRFRGNALKHAEEFFVFEAQDSECSTYADSSSESVSDLDF